MSSRDDVLTVLAAQSGDREALDRLLRSIQEPLYQRVLSIAGDRDLAEDVVQDVFMLILKKLRWLREPQHFRAWAFRIAAREAFRRIKRERRISPVDEHGALEQIEDPKPLKPLDAIAVRNVLNSMGDLPPASRAVLTLHYVDGATLSEAAQVLGLPLGTVKSRLAYGLGILRARLSDVQPED